MTIEEFDKIKWFNRTPVKYENEIRLVGSVDFSEKLVGMIQEDDDRYHWARCENVELINPNK